MSLLDIILTKKYFKFGTDHYPQLRGTSMGSPVAPGYANILDYIETQTVLQSPHVHHVRARYHFVDDVFVLWTGTDIQFNEFTEYLNGIHEVLEFTVRKNQKEMSFLDVKVTKEREGLHTSLYTKQNDKNYLLYKNSFHAPQTCAGIPKGQLMRAKRIFSEGEEYRINTFIARGYKKGELRQ